MPPAKPELLPEMVVSVTVADDQFKMPPAYSVALLPAMVLLVMVSEGPKLAMAPAQSCDVLLDKVLVPMDEGRSWRCHPRKSLR